MTLDRVAELISATEVSDDALTRCCHFRDDKYARNLLCRSPLFDILILCWKPGQATPVHDHDRQLGWVRVLRGQLEETTYSEAPLVETGRHVVPAGNAVVTVDAQRGVHRLGNPAAPSSGENAISLHVYSTPIDSCLVFDPASGDTQRRSIGFDTTPSSR